MKPTNKYISFDMPLIMEFPSSPTIYIGIDVLFNQANKKNTSDYIKPLTC